MRFIKYLLMFALIAIAIYGLSTMTHDAEAKSTAWTGNGNTNLASEAANWDNGVPQSNVSYPGDVVTFYDYQVANYGKNCTWDIWFSSENYFDINANYRGTITINSPIHCQFLIIGKHIIQNADVTWSTSKTGNVLDYEWSTGSQLDTVVNNMTITGPVVMTQYERVDMNLFLYDQWSGLINFQGSSNVITDQQHWTGWLSSDDDIKIVYNIASYLQMNHDDNIWIQINSWSGTDNFTWNMTGTESNVQFACSRMTGNGIYDVYGNGIYIQSIEASPSGIVGFTTDVTTGNYLVSKSTAIFTDDSQFNIWMILIFFLILTIISFAAYAMHIGLLNIIMLIIMMIAIPLSNNLWTEYWPFVLMFGLVNAILLLMTIMRK